MLLTVVPDSVTACQRTRYGEVSVMLLAIVPDHVTAPHKKRMKSYALNPGSSSATRPGLPPSRPSTTTSSGSTTPSAGTRTSAMSARLSLNRDPGRRHLLPGETVYRMGSGSNASRRRDRGCARAWRALRSVGRPGGRPGATRGRRPPPLEPPLPDGPRIHALRITSHPLGRCDTLGSANREDAHG
jgi:hypothetical protein